MDLVYWEIPGRSGIIFAGILLSLVLTSYYSLLYVFAGTFTILTGFNLIFVNAYNAIRTVWTGLAAEEFLHPYHIHIRPQRSSLLPRDAMDYYIHKSVDILELVAQQTAKIVFVQDTKTTSLACLASGVIYFLTSLIPTKVFFGLLIVALFTAPYYYEKHQDLVDEQLLLLQKKSLVWKEKYGAVARQQAAVHTKQIIAFSAGLIDILQQGIKKYSKRAASRNVSNAATTSTPTPENSEKL
ncbi:Reticulon-domain-containing protein [Parasitella parasitica]|nr:Reticulon-domain-containing protein [Parasitella parasitica]